MISSYDPDLGSVSYGDHTADIWLNASGENLSSMMINMIHGLYGAISESYDLEEGEIVEYPFKGEDHETCMVDLLSELLYILDAEGRIIHEPEIGIQTGESGITMYLKGNLRKFRIPIGKGRMEIKAVTYHNATIESCKGGIKGSVLLDI